MSNCASIVLALLLVNVRSAAQSADTFRVQRSYSQSKTVVYVRHVRFDSEDRLYHVQDFFENGPMQMDATYSSLNKHIKEDYQCNYRQNIKEGQFREWYLAAKYPHLFAAIAPISGFTSRASVIDQDQDKLARVPIWAFHGELDLVVAVEETRRMIEQLQDRNPELKCTIEPAVGHWIHWSVYPGEELYEWLLKHDRKSSQL